MTSTEVSIRFFERHLKEDILKYGERQAIHMAISALREQEERSKGCEFCCSFDFKTARTEVTKYGSHILLSTADTVFPNNYQFKFCPMCGRRLE